jgi:hypothetical protein
VVGDDSDPGLGGEPGLLEHAQEAADPGVGRFEGGMRLRAAGAGLVLFVVDLDEVQQEQRGLRGAQQMEGGVQPLVVGQGIGKGAVASVRARAAVSRLGTRISPAYQRQASFDRPSGSKARLLVMPWRRGGTPVTSVVWDG